VEAAVDIAPVADDVGLRAADDEPAEDGLVADAADIAGAPLLEPLFAEPNILKLAHNSRMPKKSLSLNCQSLFYFTDFHFSLKLVFVFISGDSILSWSFIY
jgi:hypothetical protein